MLFVQCRARLCDGDSEVKACNCRAMAGMWFVRWHECGMADISPFLFWRGGGQAQLWPQMLKYYGHHMHTNKNASRKHVRQQVVFGKCSCDQAHYALSKNYFFLLFTRRILNEQGVRRCCLSGWQAFGLIGPETEKRLLKRGI